MEDLINISLGTAGATAVLGYVVVFFGLVLLMLVVMLLGRIMTAKKAKAAPAVVEAAPAAAPVEKPAAPGSAGELKLYNTDPKDAAMIMAIVADSLGKPLNELRFLSIREVNEK